MSIKSGIKEKKNDKEQDGYLKEFKAEIRERKSAPLLANNSWSFSNSNGTEGVPLLNACRY